MQKTVHLAVNDSLLYDGNGSALSLCYLVFNFALSS
jgi:hypothetical protein